MIDGRRSLAATEAIIDTGSTLILGPAKEVEEFYERIPYATPAVDDNGTKSGLYTSSSSHNRFPRPSLKLQVLSSVPCDFNNTIALKFGGTAFPISPDIFNLGPVGDQSNRCYGGIAFQSKIGEKTIQ